MKNSNKLTKIKVLLDGTCTASDHELLSLCGIDTDYPSITSLFSMSFYQLLTIPGITRTSAYKIIAISELYNRKMMTIEDPGIQITTSDTVAEIFKFLRFLQHEECWVLFLNRSNRIISRERLSIGGVTATIMDTRLIIKKAIECLASAIVVVHNHPSGNRCPGEQDKRQTRVLRESLALLDIALLDHVIITSSSHFSFSDEAVV